MEKWAEYPWAVEKSLITFENEEAMSTDVIYYESTHRAERLPCEALKLIESDTQQFCTMINKRERLRHPSISQFLGVILSSSSVPEWCMFEKLEKNLQEEINKKTPFPTCDVLDIAKQICLGLVFLHSQKIVHGNLSPETVFFGRGNVVKITSVLSQQFKTNNNLSPEEDIRALGGIIILLLTPGALVCLETYKKLTTENPTLTTLLSACFAPNPASSKHLLGIIKQVAKHHTPKNGITDNKRKSADQQHPRKIRKVNHQT